MFGAILAALLSTGASAYLQKKSTDKAADEQRKALEEQNKKAQEERKARIDKLRAGALGSISGRRTLLSGSEWGQSAIGNSGGMLGDYGQKQILG